MLQPARRKYRKEHKGRNTGVATSGATVAFGDFGLKSTDRGRLTARQIEAARRAISRHPLSAGSGLTPLPIPPMGTSLPIPPTTGDGFGPAGSLPVPPR